MINKKTKATCACLLLLSATVALAGFLEKCVADSSDTGIITNCH